MSFHIPQVDNFEASTLTMPRDIRRGDEIAVDWSHTHVVLAVRPRAESADGAYIDLRTPLGATYTVYRRSALPVVQP
jgi:hypothetical protein